MSERKCGPLTLSESDLADGYEIVGCNNDVREIDIPDSIDGMPITSIGEYAFSECAKLTRVTIPDSIYSIGRGAFRGCRLLEKIDIPLGAYTSPYSFANCISLKAVRLSADIGEGAFSHCLSLCKIDITDGVTEIDDDAFEHCESLAEITLPKALTRLGALAMRGCFSLTRVTFSEPNGWYVKNCYRATDGLLDLSDPERNAEMLRSEDYDDGGLGWYKMDH